jgi:hypothetical protein
MMECATETVRAAVLPFWRLKFPVAPPMEPEGGAAGHVF